MQPLRTCEKQSFQNLILGLAGSNDNSIIPSRRQLTSQLEIKYKEYILNLTNLIEKHSYICTTADIRSTNNRSYMGTYI